MEYVTGVKPGNTIDDALLIVPYLEEAGIEWETIYDMQKDGTWTWEAFEEVLKKLTQDTDGDGVVDKYAMMSFSPRLLLPAIYSNNANFFALDENGNFVVTAGDDNVKIQ